MIEDVVHARGVPYRVGVVEEALGLLRAARVPGFNRGGDGGARVVIGPHKRQEITIGVHRAFIDSPRPFFVSGNVIRAPRHEEHGSTDSRQALCVPDALSHSPWSDGDGGLDARIGGFRKIGIGGAAIVEEVIGRCDRALLDRGTPSSSHDVHDTVAAHRVSDDGGTRRVDETAQDTPRVDAAQPVHLVQHEELIEGPVVERARERFLIGIRAVLVVDRRHDVTLAREVLSEMAQQKAAARIAVRDDDQRIAAAARKRLRVAHGASMECHHDGRVPRRHTGVFATARLARLQRGGVPDLDHEGSVVACCGFAFFRAQYVGPIPVRDLDRSNPDRERAVGGKFRGERCNGVDSVRLSGHRVGGRREEQHQKGDSRSHFKDPRASSFRSTDRSRLARDDEPANRRCTMLAKGSPCKSPTSSPKRAVSSQSPGNWGSPNHRRPRAPRC